jgi:hypothetical protein
MENKNIVRIVTCSGSCQLITAISILNYRDEKYLYCNSSNQDYLIIYGLGQKNDGLFAEFIAKLASNLHKWEKIIYITPSQIQLLISNLSNYKPKELFSIVHSWTGISEADEIYCNFNWLFENRLFMNAYSYATRICYGDSIGIYYALPFDERHQNKNFIKQDYLIKKYLRNIKNNVFEIYNKFKEYLQISTRLTPIDFDYYYLYLHGVIGDTPPITAIIPPCQNLHNTITSIEPIFDKFILEKVAILIKKFTINILLTSCLSEANRMSEDDEVSAYYQYMESLGINHNSILIIKPHPRDSISKLEKIRKRFRNLFQEIIILNQSDLFFLPFEIFFYAAFVKTGLTTNSKIRLIAFSSACISLKFLYGVECHIGFGKDICTEYFKPEYLQTRLSHERELITALSNLKDNKL